MFSISPNQAKQQLINSLKTQYQYRSQEEQIFYTKKNNTVPLLSEMKRIMLAFETFQPNEVTFALNSLLLYSCCNTTPFILEQYPCLLNQLKSYLIEIMKNIPYFNSFQKISPKDQITKVYNQPLSLLIKKMEKSPGEVLKQNYDMLITKQYSYLDEIQLLEQVRAIFQILRNLSFTKANEQTLVENTELFNFLIDIFQKCQDKEITIYLLEIFSNLCNHIILEKVKGADVFCNKIISFLKFDSDETVLAAITAIRNLIITQENESFFEQKLGEYIEQINRLLAGNISEVRQITLEFLCFLTDLKMSTRVRLAKEPKLLSRLVALLASGGQSSMKRIVHLAAQVLSNITMAPATLQYFLPLEKDLFVIAATDSSVSKIIAAILSEIDNLHQTKK